MNALKHQDILNTNFDGTQNVMDPIGQAFTSISMSNNEVRTFSKMKKQQDKSHFEQAMFKETSAMFDNKCWETVPIQEINDYYDELDSKDVYFKMKSISLIWNFKRKRNADGSLSKCKARTCCHIGQQELGINYWETHAPVVNRTSVRMMIIISTIHALESKSIYFTLAYSQEDIKTSIYLCPPQGIELR